MKIEKIAFGGDTGLGTRYFKNEKWAHVLERVKQKPISFFEGVKPHLGDIDYLVVNLETVLSYSDGEPAPGKLYCGIDDPDDTISCLKYIGANSVSLANNHAMDFGIEKLLETMVHLQASDIKVIGGGASRDAALKPDVVTVSGRDGYTRNIYVLSALRAPKRYSEYGFFAKGDRPGLARSTAVRIDEIVSNIKAKDPTAYIIYYPHWQGRDYSEVGESIANYCRDRVDAGVDMIVGHGTHTIGKIEYYNKSFIFHSIGNFVFNTQGQYSKTGAPPYGMVLKLDFSKTSHESRNPVISILPLLVDNRSTNFMTYPQNDFDAFNESVVKFCGCDDNIKFTKEKRDETWVRISSP